MKESSSGLTGGMTAIVARRWSRFALFLVVQVFITAAVNYSGKAEPSIDEGDDESSANLAEFKRRLHPDRSLAAWREVCLFPQRKEVCMYVCMYLLNCTCMYGHHI